jgi:hypothetical protein
MKATVGSWADFGRMFAAIGAEDVRWHRCVRKKTSRFESGQ